jgi:hypothetical protein
VLCPNFRFPDFETIQSLDPGHNFKSNKSRNERRRKKNPHAPPCGATASMRHPPAAAVAAAAELPKPHLAKETTAEAEAEAGGPAVRRAETEAAAPVGHRMHESVICEANSVS